MTKSHNAPCVGRPAEPACQNRSRNPVILIAPNAFKGSLTAEQAAEAIARGFRRVFPRARCVLAPIADGGDGVMPVLARALGCRIRRCRCTGPLGETLTASFAFKPKDGVAVIEAAEACGLRLLPQARRNPMRAGTFGVGTMLLNARRAGARRIVVGVGGTATVDAGLGLAEALGFRLFDAKGRRLRGTGGALSRLHAIEGWDIRQYWQRIKMQVAVDVTNPLAGKSGAARVFGPQKGATPSMVRRLDAGLGRFAEVIRRDLGLDVGRMPGSGAAGGLAAGLVAFCGADIVPGFDLIAGLVGLPQKMSNADFVVTGEGFLDAQSLCGKAPLGVAAMAKSLGLPVICMAGGISDDLRGLEALGISALAVLPNAPMPLEQAMKNAARYLEAASERAASLMALGKRLPWRFMKPLSLAAYG